MTVRSTDTPPWSFGSKLQAFETIEPMNSLFIDVNALAFEEHMNTLITIADACAHYFFYPFSQGRRRRFEMLITKGRSRPFCELASSMTLRYAYHFRELISCSIAWSKLRSATSFFSRTFSSLSCFSSFKLV